MNSQNSLMAKTMDRAGATLLAIMVAALVLIGFATMADASEVTGTVSTATTSESVSAAGGSIGATVGQPTPGSSMSGGNSARRAANLAALATQEQAPTYSADDIIIYLDGSGPTEAGIGGGYDPILESELAALANGSEESDAGDATVDSSDAIAFNEGLGIAPTQVAAAGASDGMSSGKIWTTVILGLALLGLAGYAASSYVAYRRERTY